MSLCANGQCGIPETQDEKGVLTTFFEGAVEWSDSPDMLREVPKRLRLGILLSDEQFDRLVTGVDPNIQVLDDIEREWNRRMSLLMGRNIMVGSEVSPTMRSSGEEAHLVLFFYNMTKKDLIQKLGNNNSVMGIGRDMDDDTLLAHVIKATTPSNNVLTQDLGL